MMHKPEKESKNAQNGGLSPMLRPFVISKSALTVLGRGRLEVRQEKKTMSPPTVKRVEMLWLHAVTSSLPSFNSEPRESDTVLAGSALPRLHVLMPDERSLKTSPHSTTPPRWHKSSIPPL